MLLRKECHEIQIDTDRIILFVCVLGTFDHPQSTHTYTVNTIVSESNRITRVSSGNMVLVMMAKVAYPMALYQPSPSHIPLTLRLIHIPLSLSLLHYIHSQRLIIQDSPQSRGLSSSTARPHTAPGVRAWEGVA